MDSNKYSVKVGIKLAENAVANVQKDLNEKLKNEKFEVSFSSKGLDEISKKLDDISTKLGNVSKSDGFNKTSSTAKKAAKEVDNLNNKMEKTGKHLKNQAFATDNWAYNWSKAMQSFLTYNTVTQFFNTVSNGIKDMILEVKDLDDSLVELKKVTDLEGDSLSKFVEQAYSAGREVAKTGKEMVDAATSFAKAGYDESDVLGLGKVAAMYTNIADEEISAADSADFIIAQLKAFNLEAETTNGTLENAYHIIDAVNEVSNNYAVSSADIATNMGKASAVMANAGNSMEQMIGLMTAGTEITRNASKVANGLKTITLRLQGMNDEGEKDLELQAQMEALFNKLGVSVYDANGELKNTYDILATLAPVYKDLTNAEKAYVTETIAGKYQAQNAAAILMNWSTAVDATTTAMNSQGSAARENEAVLDSVQGHLQSLQSAWSELSNTIFSSDLLKAVIDLGTGLLKIANSDVVQGIAKVAAILTMVNLTMNILSNSYNKLTARMTANTVASKLNALSNEKITKAQKKEITQLLLSASSYNKNTRELNKETKAKIAAILASSNLTKKEKEQAIAAVTGAVAEKTLTKATWTLKGAWDALTASIAANPIGAAIMLAVGAVSATVSILNASSEAAEEARKKAEEAEEESRANAVEDANNLKERNSTLDEYIEKYKTLKKELSNENTGYSRSVELRSEILDLQTQINDLMGDENNGIDLINDNLDEVIKKQSQIKKDAAADYMAANASAIKKAQDNLSGNYYNTNKRKQIITEERNWYEWDWDESQKEFQQKYESLMQAMADAYGKTINYSSVLGGTNEDHTGFDKKSFIELDMDMTAEEALDMWKETYENLKKNKEYYVKEYGLSDEDYDLIVSVSNENYKKLQDYVNKQNEVLNAAAEHMVYSDETYSKKIDELNAAGAEYNIAQANKDAKAMEEAVKKITDLSSYIDGIKDPTVKKYFQNIIKQWEDDINRNKIKDGLEKINDDIKNSLKGKNISGDNFGEIFEQYRQGIKDGLDENQLSLLASLNKLFEEGGYDVETFTNYLERLGIIGKSTKTVFEDTESTIGSLGEQIGKISEKYDILTGAVDEYNEKGYISASTFKSLTDNNLLDYLTWTNDSLQANTQSLLNEADALKINALASLQESYAKDVLAIANNDLSSGTPYLTQALNDEKNAISGLGDLAKAQTGGLFDLAKAQAAVQAAGKNFDEKAYGDKLNKLNKYYNNLAQSVANINIGSNPSGTYKGSGSGSGSGSSSKSEKEWWEKAYDDLKDQFDYSDITIEQYISGLENLLGKLDKGSDAWKKINKELQKAKLDKIKDDYDAGRISLNQYIISLQNLQKAYKAGTDAWNDLASAIKKAKLDKLKEQQNDLKSALSAVNNTLDKQIDKYEEAKDAADKKYDDEIDKLEELQDKLDDQNDDYERAQKAVADYLDEQMSAMEKQRDTVESYYDNVLDAIEKMNEKQQESLELAEAYEALMNAMTQKTKKVYKEGLGKELAEYKDNYIGQMLEAVQTEVRLNLRWCVYG